MFSIIRNSLRLSLTSLVICGVLLSAALAGCDPAQGSPNGNGTPTLTVTWPPPPPSPSPTQPPPPPCQPTTTDFYSICVPNGWISSPQGNGLIYHDAAYDNGFAVFVGGAIPDLNAAIEAYVQSLGWTNVQMLSLNPTTVQSGETWNQAEIEGDDAQGNRLTARILVTDHQPTGGNTMGFVLAYTASANTFAREDGAVFTPMLNSFAFR